MLSKERKTSMYWLHFLNFSLNFVFKYKFLISWIKIKIISNWVISIELWTIYLVIYLNDLCKTTTNNNCDIIGSIEKWVPILTFSIPEKKIKVKIVNFNPKAYSY